MTRRTHACLGCYDPQPIDGGRNPFGGNRRTRHADRICSWCRRRGIHVRNGQVVVPIRINYRGRGA